MQIISKDGKVKCVAHSHYPPEIIRQMKAAGYEVVVKRPVSGSDTKKAKR